MYLKYTVNGNTTQNAASGTGQIAWEISEILMGNITDMSTLSYGSAVTEGTGPTAGVYTRQRPTSSGSHPHIRFKKKHCQYDASTLPAEAILQVFDDGGNYQTLKVSDKDGANVGASSYFCNANQAQEGTPYRAGHTYHFIFNDTTFVFGFTQNEEANPNNDRYAFGVWSDFEKNAYDEYAIGVNSKYYPGGMYHGACRGAKVAYYNETNNYMSMYRFQFQNQSNGTFGNSYMESNYSSNESYGPSTYTTQATHSMYPPPYKRIFKTWGPSGHSITMAPILYNGQTLQADDYTWSNTETTYLPYRDARFHCPMLNCYRITDATGSMGDIIQTADNTQYYVFIGHRVGHGNISTAAQSSTYHQTCFAFPKNNVPIT